MYSEKAHGADIGGSWTEMKMSKKKLFVSNSSGNSSDIQNLPEMRRWGERASGQ